MKPRWRFRFRFVTVRLRARARRCSRRDRFPAWPRPLARFHPAWATVGDQVDDRPQRPALHAAVRRILWSRLGRTGSKTGQVGGLDSVRGYRANRFVRDNGFAGTLELDAPQFSLPVPGVSQRSADGRLSLIPFADLGRSWDTDTGAETGGDTGADDWLASVAGRPAVAGRPKDRPGPQSGQTADRPSSEQRVGPAGLRRPLPRQDRLRLTAAGTPMWCSPDGLSRRAAGFLHNNRRLVRRQVGRPSDPKRK